MLAAFGFTAVLVLLLAAFLRWRRRTFSYFKDLGIPGPEPNLIWGNLWEYHEKGVFRALDKWCEKYGDVFGFYNGDVPVIVVKDLDFLQYVFVKSSSNFTDRGVTIRSDEMHPYLSQCLVHAKGTHWKSTRQFVSSGFTSSKMKQMMGHIAEMCDVFMDVLGEDADNGIEVCMVSKFQGLTMDYLGRAAFGIDASFQRDLDHPFLITAKEAAHGLMTGPIHMVAQCTTSFGNLATPLLWLNWIFGAFPVRKFAEHAAKVIRLRKNNPELRRNDILQNLIDAEYKELPTTPKTVSERTKIMGTLGTHTMRTLRFEEVVMNTTLLFLAGFETTATALCYVTYALAKYPDVQERVRNEVNEALDGSGCLDYEAVTQKLKYLGQVVDEALRLWPPILTFSTRQAREDFEYQGIKYRAGTCIMAPTLQIHRDARFFADPMKFDPDRFSAENDGCFPKIAYQPFGLGPRNCVGSMLALLEITYTIAMMTHRYRWELGQSQKGEMPLDQYAMVSIPGRGPWIVFHRV
uniref:Cytochrome n=1 Tax=Ixodes ricinus TaxID=34613 RepID=A0A6B0VED6_IXORI